jgi:hypothetical protein
VLLEDPACRRRRLEHREDDVLDRDVLVLQPLRLILGVVQQQRQVASDPGVAGARARDLRTSLELVLGRSPQRADRYRHALKEPRNQSVGLLQQRQQQVFDTDLLMPVAQRLRLRVVQRFLGSSASAGSGP